MTYMMAGPMPIDAQGDNDPDMDEALRWSPQAARAVERDEPAHRLRIGNGDADVA